MSSIAVLVKPRHKDESERRLVKVKASTDALLEAQKEKNDILIHLAADLDLQTIQYDEKTNMLTPREKVK